MNAARRILPTCRFCAKIFLIVSQLSGANGEWTGSDDLDHAARQRAMREARNHRFQRPGAARAAVQAVQEICSICNHQMFNHDRRHPERAFHANVRYNIIHRVRNDPCANGHPICNACFRAHIRGVFANRGLIDRNELECPFCRQRVHYPFNMCVGLIDTHTDHGIGEARLPWPPDGLVFNPNTRWFAAVPGGPFDHDGGLFAQDVLQHAVNPDGPWFGNIPDGPPVEQADVGHNIQPLPLVDPFVAARQNMDMVVRDINRFIQPNDVGHPLRRGPVDAPLFIHDHDDVDANIQLPPHFVNFLDDDPLIYAQHADINEPNINEPNNDGRSGAIEQVVIFYRGETRDSCLPYIVGPFNVAGGVVGSALLLEQAPATHSCCMHMLGATAIAGLHAAGGMLLTASLFGIGMVVGQTYLRSVEWAQRDVRGPLMREPNVQQHRIGRHWESEALHAVRNNFTYFGVGEMNVNFLEEWTISEGYVRYEYIDVSVLLFRHLCRHYAGNVPTDNLFSNMKNYAMNLPQTRRFGINLIINTCVAANQWLSYTNYVGSFTSGRVAPVWRTTFA